MSGLLSGCAELNEMEPVYAEIPWHWFQTDEDKAELQEVDLPIPTSMDMSYRGEKEQLALWTDKIQALQEFITDKDVYLDALSDRTVFDAKIGSILGDSYREQVSNELFSLLEEVYGTGYNQPYSLNLTGLGRSLDGEVEKSILTFDLNVFQDTEEYKIYPVVMTVNEQGVAESFKWQDSFENPITRRSLMDDAFIEENYQDLFQKEWSEFSKTIQDETLYAYVMENDVSDEKDIRQKVKPLAHENMTEDTLIHLFMDSRGSLSNGAITAFRVSDEDALAQTVYRYIVPVVDGMKEYEIVYSRVENKIISVSERGEGKE